MNLPGRLRAYLVRIFLFAIATAASVGTWYAKDTGKDVASVLARRNWWAFQKPASPPIPAVESAWVRTPIDAFLLDAMRAKKLSPSAQAGPEKLLRRVTYDLTGLPPASGESDLFLNDRSPNAYEKVVDRLLASPHYGERWALRWLDVVRYADTNGYEQDAERPNAWRYRDYIVNAFNSDKPYDRFIREQIAGDEIYPGDALALIATGFHRCGPMHIVGGNQDEEVNRQEVLTEMTSAIGSVFLGMTVGCARCHNHKFDPILQSDYYRLQAIFAATEGKEVDIYTPEQKEQHEREMKAYEERLAPVKKALGELEKPYMARLREQRIASLEPKYREALAVPKDRRSPQQTVLAKNAEDQAKPAWNDLVAALSPEDKAKRAGLRRQLHDVELTKPAPLAAANAVVNKNEAPATFVLRVGDPKNKLDQVEPGVPLVIANGTTAPEAAVGRRTALANWLASPDHPLTARVMVNRIWQFRMGAGLVRTPNDFGVLGDRPGEHQKLLDWLATEFVARGWSVKAMDRMIVLSSAYQQETRDDEARSQIDPDNRYYWRMNRKRMEGETIRDSVLAAAGTLNPRLGGRPVRVPIEPEVYDLIFTEGERDGLWPVLRDQNEHWRRSLYLLNKRSVRLPMMNAFDQPDTMTSCPARPLSTHALQALNLFNSEFMHEQSGLMAKRLERECGGQTGCELRRAYKLALARAPRPEEFKLSSNFLKTEGNLADFCLALLNRNEFVYIP